MRRFWALLCVLIFAAGCESEGGRGFFDDAIKDWNGDNMRMRSGAKWDELPSRTLPGAMN